MMQNTAKVQPEIICEAVAVVPTKDRFGSAGTVLEKSRVRPNNNNTHTQWSSHKNLHLSNSVVSKERIDTE